MEGLSNSKGEHYNLRWNNYSNNLIQVFSEHKNNEKLVDVTLICEEQYIKAHKLVLSACSGFFQEMFRRQGGICGSVVHPFVVLNGIKYSHLKYILDFIYQGEIKVLDSDLEAILELGEKFQVRGLSSVKLKPKVPNDMQRTPSIRTEIPVQYPPAAKATSSRQSTTPEPSKIEIPSIRKIIKEKFSYSDKSTYEIEPPQKRVKAIEPTIKANLIDKNQVQQIVDPILPEALTTHKHSPNISKEECNPLKKVVVVSKTKDNISNNEKLTENQKGDSFMDRPDARKGSSLPKSTNPFMIFTNEWRKKLEVEHPNENNKEISIRLGTLWKNLSTETKQTYYKAARKAQLETDLFPGNVGNTPFPGSRRKSLDAISVMSIDSQNDNDVQVIDYSGGSHSEGSANSN